MELRKPTVADASDAEPASHLGHKNGFNLRPSLRGLLKVRQLLFRRVYPHRAVLTTYHKGAIFKMAAIIAHNIQQT